MKEIVSEEFKTEVLENQSPVLVDFYSIGCGPCRSMEPVLKAAEERHPDIKFVKIEASDGMDVFTEYKVNRVPTFIIFNEGKAVDQKLGIVPAEKLDEWFNEKVKNG